MGNCVGGSSGGENIFKVININDDKNLVQKGQMEVTASELIYVDGKSKEDWHWPLKYLRKYGCDGDVFTFEAGRKCPGGEGLYAFETKKASLLFEIVARNINQGDLSPLPDPNAQVTDSTIMNFPPRRNSTVSPTPHGEQPSYTNIDMMGNPLENGNNHTPPHQPSAESAGPDPKKVMYREVVFDKPPEEHPKPSTAPPKSNTSYTQIDFDQTARYNEEMKRGGGALPSTTTPHNRTSSTSTVTSGGNRSPTKRIHGGRRLHTISTSSSAHDRHARSESSYSSQSSLTESSRDIRTPPKHNGGPRHFSTPDPNNPAPSSSMYQNVNVGVVSEQQYQNVQVGAGEVSQVFDTSTPKPHPQHQPNYCNLSLSATAGGDTPSSDSGRGSGVAILNGDSMMTYAQLQLSSRGSSGGKKPRSTSMSSSTGRSSRDSGPQSSYMQLDFQNTSATPTAGKGPAQRSASVSVVPGPTSGSNAPSTTTTSSGSLAAPPTTLAQQQSIPEEETPTSLPAASATPTAPVDETKVTYGVLNFPQMEALRVLSKEREQAIEQEQREREQREKEKEKSASHKKKK